MDMFDKKHVLFILFNFDICSYYKDSKNLKIAILICRNMKSKQLLIAHYPYAKLVGLQVPFETFLSLFIYA